MAVALLGETRRTPGRELVALPCAGVVAGQLQQVPRTVCGRWWRTIRSSPSSVSSGSSAARGPRVIATATAWLSVTIGFGAIRLSSGLARAVGQARNRTPKAVQRTVPFGLICLSLTVVWYATAGHAPADAAERRSRARWYTTKLGTPQNRAVLAAWAAALRTWLGDHPDHPHGTPADDRS